MRPLPFRASFSLRIVDPCRVKISVTTTRKHKLPVDVSCRWSHPPGIVHGVPACRTLDGAPVASYADLWTCMQEAACEISGGRVALVLFEEKFFVLSQLPVNTRSNDGPIGHEIARSDQTPCPSSPVVRATADRQQVTPPTDSTEPMALLYADYCSLRGAFKLSNP